MAEPVLRIIANSRMYDYNRFRLNMDAWRTCFKQRSAAVALFYFFLKFPNHAGLAMADEKQYFNHYSNL